MVTKTKKNRKKSKIQNVEKQNKKNGLEIWWKGTSPANLAMLCLTVSEKTGNKFYGRADGRPRDDSSSPVKSHKAELKILSHTCHLT